MKLYCKIFLLLLFCNNVFADYGYMSLPQLVCNADYGVVGTIVKVDMNYFYLKTEQFVLNTLDRDTLPIVKFENWPCGKRYSEYKVGQRELVFFRKSNYVIDDYELIGYGGGDEFELPIFGDTIKYQKGYNLLQPYLLRDLLTAIIDYGKLTSQNKGTSKTLTKIEQDYFSKKSALHKLFIECKTQQTETDFEIPSKGILVNLERNYLYEDYENKIFVSRLNNDSIFLEVEDADVWKTKDYFIVKPKSGWTRRWLNVYAIDDKKEKKLILNQLYEVIDLPEPSVYFGSSIKDTIKISYYRDAIPSIGYFLDELHKDKYLKYTLLSYEYEIISNGTTELFKIKSEYGTKEFQERIRNIKSGDKVCLKNVFALYPNNKVRQIKNKTIIFETE